MTAARAATWSRTPISSPASRRSPHRPGLLIGFAAETEHVIEHATAKRTRKGEDWIVANDVSGDVMGGTANAVHLMTADGVESWERLPKEEVGERLAERIRGR